MWEPVLPVRAGKVRDLTDVYENGFDGMDADDFLAFVRQEAASLPVVSRVEVKAVGGGSGGGEDQYPSSSSAASRKTAYMPHFDDVATCDPSMLPSKDWEDESIAVFERLRASMEAVEASMGKVDRHIVVPSMKDAKKWHHFCFGENENENEVEDEHEDEDEDEDENDDEEEEEDEEAGEEEEGEEEAEEEEEEEV